MRALIVDDEHDIGLMVSHFLKKEGVEAEYVSRIELAKDLLEVASENFDVYFLDLNLPDGTGFDLVPLIKTTSQNARIIIISAYDGVLETNKAELLEVDAFLRKPFTKKEIINALFGEPNMNR